MHDNTPNQKNTADAMHAEIIIVASFIAIHHDTNGEKGAMPKQTDKCELTCHDLFPLFFRSFLCLARLKENIIEKTIDDNTSSKFDVLYRDLS